MKTKVVLTIILCTIYLPIAGCLIDEAANIHPDATGLDGRWTEGAVLFWTFIAISTFIGGLWGIWIDTRRD